MADKVKRTPAKLSKLVEDFDMEIVCRGSDYDQRTVSISARPCSWWAFTTTSSPSACRCSASPR